jgi:hypothetical protein
MQFNMLMYEHLSDKSKNYLDKFQLKFHLLKQNINFNLLCFLTHFTSYTWNLRSVSFFFTQIYSNVGIMHLRRGLNLFHLGVL